MVSTELTQSREGGYFRAIADSVILAWDWRRRAIAFGAGAVGALALPPFDFLPAIAAPMMAAVWLIDGSAAAQAGGRSTVRSVRSAFAAGWWWGLGYFVAGLWWVGAAFLVEADKFAWALPFGVLALPAGLAFFPAIGFAIARLLWSPGPARVLALAIGLGVSEWLRAVVLTGFPWNEIGMALGQNLVLAQFASIAGLHGLTLLTIAIFAAPATLADEANGSWLTRPIGLAVVALAALAAFGTYRLSAPEAATLAGVKLRIMQTDMAQDGSFGPQNKEAILRRYLDLSDRATSPSSTGVADVTHLIWPESAFPFLLARDPKALAQIADLLSGGATLITGAARLAEPTPGDRRLHYFNSIQVVDRRGALLDRYDKIHLVPFGEYLPWADLLDRLGVTQFVHFPGGFRRRRRPRRSARSRAARRASADLLRSGLSTGHRLRVQGRRAPRGLDAQPDGRRLVRADAGALPAFRASPPAGHRDRPAAGSRRQRRHIGGRRRPRPRHGAASFGSRKRARQPVAGAAPADFLQPIRGPRAAVDARGAAGCFDARPSKAPKVIRLVVRILAFALLAGAFAACVIDGARWIATDQWKFTPIGETLDWAFPNKFLLVQNFIERHNPLALNVLWAPTWAVLGVIGVGLFYLVRRRPPPIGHSNRSR